MEIRLFLLSYFLCLIQVNSIILLLTFLTLFCRKLTIIDVIDMSESNMTNPNHMLQTDAMNIIYESMSNLGEKINFL